MEPVLHLLPQAGTSETSFDDVVQHRPIPHALKARPVGDIFVDRFGKGIRFLKYHSHTLAQIRDINPGIKNINVVNEDIPLMPRAFDQIIQTVHTAKQRRFSASGRPNKGRHFMLRNPDVDIEQRLNRAVEKAEPLDSKLGLRLHDVFLRE